MWVHAKRLRPLQLLVPLSSACRDERVNYQPVKVLNLLLFLYFILKWRKTFEKLHFFLSGPKQCFYLTHSAREVFKILAFKKQNGTSNGCISKPGAISVLKLTFSESSFNYLQNSVVFCTLYPGGYTLRSSTPYNTRCNYHQLAEMRELTMSQKKFWICSFLYFISKWRKTCQKLYFFIFGPKQCFYLTHSA